MSQILSSCFLKSIDWGHRLMMARSIVVVSNRWREHMSTAKIAGLVHRWPGFAECGPGSRKLRDSKTARLRKSVVDGWSGHFSSQYGHTLVGSRSVGVISASSSSRWDVVLIGDGIYGDESRSAWEKFPFVDLGFGISTSESSISITSRVLVTNCIQEKFWSGSCLNWSMRPLFDW